MDKNKKLKAKACELLKYFTPIQTNFPDFFLYIFSNEKNIQKLLNSADFHNFIQSDDCQNYIETYLKKLEEFKTKSDIIASWENNPSDEFLEYSARTNHCIQPIDQTKIEDLKKITEGIQQSFLSVKQSYEMIGLDPKVMENIKQEIDLTHHLGKD